MTWSKRLGCCLALGLVILALGAGCGGSDGGGGGSLEGAWDLSTYNGAPAPAGVDVSITFFGDGTYRGITRSNGVSAIEDGTWWTEGSTLYTMHEGETEFVTYSLNGDTLTLIDPEGVFVLVR